MRSGYVVIIPPPEIDLASAPALKTQILSNDPTHTIVLNLSGVEFCDSSGVSVFVAAHLHTEAAGGELVLRNPGPRLLRVLEVSGVLGALTIEHDHT